MAVPLPPGFIHIQTAKSITGGSVSLLSTVVDVLPPRPAGSSFTSTFTLSDNPLTTDSFNGLKVRIFKKDEACLPAPQVGDVVLLRTIRMSSYKNQTIAVSTDNEATPCAIFRKSKNQLNNTTVLKYPQNAYVSAPEEDYAMSLLMDDARKSNVSWEYPRVNNPTRFSPANTNSYNSPYSQMPHNAASPNLSTARTPTPNSRRKFSLIKDVSFQTFVDIVGQVVKTYPEVEKVLLYVTDYTENKELFNYTSPMEDNSRDGDNFNYIGRSRRAWPGPYGQMTLQVTLWEPHAYFARQNVREDDFVLLENVHIKQDKYSGRMEANIHTDRIYQNKVFVSVISDDDRDQRVKDLLRRKVDYWRRYKAQNSRAGNGSGKRLLSDDDSAGNKPTNKKKQKKKKKEKERKDKRDEDQSEISESLVPKREQLNTHIRANNPAVPCRSISDILENESHTNKTPDGIEYKLPFQNLRYRASVRVVDFFPPKLEDFAVQYNTEYAMLSDAEESMDSVDSDSDGRVAGKRRWEWRFCLLVEDAGPGVPQNRKGERPRMKLFVHDVDAVFLLRMDAVDLRKKPAALAELKEKLFIVWGDLEERKSANPESFGPNDYQTVSAKPFTCCIKEYGVRVTRDFSEDDDSEETCQSPNPLGWERRFRIFGTTIS